jgi:hypothetical protein
MLDLSYQNTTLLTTEIAARKSEQNPSSENNLTNQINVHVELFLCNEKVLPQSHYIADYQKS